MTVKVINIVLDEEEYAYALSKKGKRTWRMIFMDGIEWRVYKKPRR
jgi:hypothetical protein